MIVVWGKITTLLHSQVEDGAEVATGAKLKSLLAAWKCYEKKEWGA
jgi:hypothetical protein